jgi:peptide deformylase
MVSKILKYGSPLLRKKSIEIDEENAVESIILDLFDTLENFDGIGLSGVQIGITKRIFVIDTSKLAKEYPDVPIIKKAFINPIVIDKSNIETPYPEGCLSIPGIQELVNRPETITVNYQDTQFQDIEAELNGIEARIFQHEYDHLDGILFIDKLSPLRKAVLAGKLNKIKKQNRIIKAS